MFGAHRAALLKGSSVVLPPPVVTNAFFASDGAALPFGSSIQTPSAVYDSGSNATYFAWESQLSNAVRSATCGVYNHANGKFKGPYTIGINPLVNTDSHGVPVLCRDSAGYVYCMFGEHASALQLASTVNPNDVTRWRALAVGPNPASFARMYLVGSVLYLFYLGQGSGAETQSAIIVQQYTFASGILTASGSPVKLTDFVNNWCFMGNGLVVGTDIWLLYSNVATGGTSAQDVFLLRYDTTTGNIRNIDASTTTIPASQPITLATSQASYRVVNQAGSSRFGTAHNAMYHDGTNVHLTYADSAQSTAGVCSLLYNIYSSGAWGSPVTVFSYPAATVPTFISPAVGPNVNSGVDIYYADATFAGDAPDVSGNIYRVTRDSNGTVHAAVLVQSAGAFGLNIPSAIPNSHVNARVAFCEVTSDESTSSGTPGILKSFCVGDAGPLLITTQYFGPAQDVFDRISVLPNTRWLLAYNALMLTLYQWGLLYSLDVYYRADGPDTQSSRLNLVQNAWNLTVGGGAPTQVAKVGVTANGTTDFLDSGLNTSSAVGRRCVGTSASVFASFPSLISANNGAGSRDVSANGLFIQATATNLIARLNRFNSINVATGNGVGFYGATVQGSNANAGFWQNNATTGGPAAMSSGTNSNSTFIIGGIGSTTLLNCVTAMAGGGQLISQAQLNQLYLAELAWKAAIAKA